MRLVSSLIVKTSYTADAFNEILSVNGENISVFKTDWKYYLNLAGLPYIGEHSYNSDPTNMEIYSIDTDETISFDVITMVQHPETLAELRRLDTSYKNLLVKYPDQEILIRGIINPIPIDISVNANEYQILHYSPEYVDYNETNLIPLLQEYIYRFTTRWDNVDFRLSDALYPASFIGILFSTLPTEIINIRLANCKTPYVHHWHVWNYLSGYFNLEIHRDVLPYEQALFLYRNIDYIIANSGTSKILDFLNEGFAKPFNLDLFSFSVRKKSTSALLNLNQKNLHKLDSDIFVIKYPYGQSLIRNSHVIKLTVKQFVQSLSLTGLKNPELINSDIKAITLGANTSEPNDIITGVIEGNVAKNVTLDMVPSTLEHAINWFYLVSHDYIKFKISLDLADVGISNFLIDANDAAILYLYANAKLSNTDSVNIPEFWAPDVMVNDIFSDTERLGLVRSKFLYGDNFNVYDSVKSSRVFAKNVYSLTEFNTLVTKIINSKFLHLVIMSHESDYDARSEVLSLIWSFYETVKCTFVSETTYVEVLNRLRLDSSTWTDITYQEIIAQISKKFIGIELETTTIQSPYSNMLDVLNQLCSYTVTFVAGAATNYTAPIYLNLPTGKVSYVNLNAETYVDVSVDVVSPYNILSISNSVGGCDVTVLGGSTNTLFGSSKFDCSIYTSASTQNRSVAYVSLETDLTTEQLS
jgi:hypothetical protein